MKLYIRLYVYPIYIRNKKKNEKKYESKKKERKKKSYLGLETILKTLLEKNTKE